MVLGTVLNRNPRTVTLYHTIQHFSTLFMNLGPSYEADKQGGEIYFTQYYT